ncbi:phage tail protein [Dinoroseobacter sp. PD6]|uniref:phage tail protein n=1 Tax=Dinoroseobacter sp. PD6 TaxID=3028384 RepID=UPI00237C297A|nr:phage tail protein [Dinoroseobacter sp. PD6]MDD9716285.1 phage tail protein [Dinoroseobacter sp. PD6]
MTYYPPVAFSFTVRIAGNAAVVDQGFQEVSGLTAERAMTPLEEGGENRFAHKLPGKVKLPNLVLKRGMMLASSPLFTWCKSVIEGDLGVPIEPKSLSVSLLDAKAKPTMSWSVVEAWPVKWTVDSFDAQKNSIAVESIELAYQRVERKINQMQKANTPGT